jgi:uncharacterized protein YutE (UPF0331/DUF86 family)
MDESVILTKIDSLRRCIERIRLKTPQSADLLREDFDLQDIISVNLERAVQTTVDIAAHILAEANTPPPATMAESFKRLATDGLLPEQLTEHLVKAVGFRNISVHAYHQINWDIVFSIITERLDDFSGFASHILKALKHASGTTPTS